eukprot:7037114-Heterocapsa_arctica.AAC.1
MRNAVNTLRRLNGLFSHSFIYDAILVSNRIPANEVKEAIVQASAELNIRGVQVNAKSLKTEQLAAEKDTITAGIRSHSANKLAT